MTLLDVPGAANKCRQFSDTRALPQRRSHESLDVRRTSDCDRDDNDEYDPDRHYYVPSPNRSRLKEFVKKQAF